MKLNFSIVVSAFGLILSGVVFYNSTTKYPNEVWSFWIWLIIGIILAALSLVRLYIEIELAVSEAKLEKLSQIEEKYNTHLEEIIDFRNKINDKYVKIDELLKETIEMNETVKLRNADAASRLQTAQQLLNKAESLDSKDSSAG